MPQQPGAQTSAQTCMSDIGYFSGFALCIEPPPVNVLSEVEPQSRKCELSKVTYPAAEIFVKMRI